MKHIDGCQHDRRPAYCSPPGSRPGGNALRPDAGAKIFAALAAVWLIASPLMAQRPEWTHVFPPGAAVGTKTELALGGDFDKWPPEIWLSHGRLEITAQKEKGKLDLQVPADAAPGLYLMRLFNQDGVSDIRPLLIGKIPEQNEREPNDSFDALKPLDAPLTVNGRLQSRGDVDAFAIPLSRGQRLVASLVANRWLGSPMDGVLQICTPEGFVLAQSDDERGLDPQLVFAAAEDGLYVVRLFAFPEKPNSSVAFAGGEDYLYRLTLTASAFVDHGLPLAVSARQETMVKLCGWNLPQPAPVVSVNPADAELFAVGASPDHAGWALLPVVDRPAATVEEPCSADQPQTVELPITICGHIEQADDVDAIRFDAVQGQRISIAAQSNTLGYPLDPLIQLIDAEGKLLQEVDDANRTRDPVINRNIPSDGQYTVTIRDAHLRGGDSFVYRLDVTIAQPDYRLSLAESSFVVAGGGKLEIPVTVTRQAGFAEPIQIEAVDLPEGATADQVTSEPKGDSAKQVKLVIQAAAKATQGVIRIFGHSQGERKLDRVAKYSTIGGQLQRSDIWVTVAPK